MYPCEFFLLIRLGVETLVGKMQVSDVRRHSAVDERKEQVEAALARLRFLKCRVSELRAQCEALKKRQAEKDDEALVCSDCGKLIEPGQEVTLKNSFGEVKSHYHKDCFKKIWLSQNWIFDYSSPGFLRMSEKDQ
jgi:hypothetical protein